MLVKCYGRLCGLYKDAAEFRVWGRLQWFRGIREYRYPLGYQGHSRLVLGQWKGGWKLL